jgi:hypothetical protein
VTNTSLVFWMGQSIIRVSGGAIGTWTVIQRTGIPRVYVIVLGFRSRALVIVSARTVERRGYETKTWQPPKAGSEKFDVTNADSRVYVLHCLIWNDRKLEAAQSVQRHTNEGKGVSGGREAGSILLFVGW